MKLLRYATWKGAQKHHEKKERLFSLASHGCVLHEFILILLLTGISILLTCGSIAILSSASVRSASTTNIAGLILSPILIWITTFFAARETFHMIRAKKMMKSKEYRC